MNVFLLKEKAYAMRAAGINDSNIAVIIGEIRTHSIQEERMRQEDVVRKNPPSYRPWPELAKIITRDVP